MDLHPHRQYLISSESTKQNPYFRISTESWMNVLSFLTSKDISYLAVNSSFIFNILSENAEDICEQFKKRESDIIWQFMNTSFTTRQERFHNAAHFINLSYVYERSQFPKAWYNELYFNEIGEQCSFLRNAEEHKLSLQLMSLLMYYKFPIYYAHRCIRLKEPQRKFMLEQLKENGNKSDGIKYYNPYSGGAYYYTGIHQNTQFLEIVTKLTLYGYDSLVISSMIKHYRPKSMAIMFNLMTEGVDKDVLYELAKISSIYNSKDIECFLDIRKELSGYEITDEDVLQMCIRHGEQKETFIRMIKAGIPSTIALNFSIKEHMLPDKDHLQMYIDIIRDAMTQYNVSEDSLVKYFKQFQYRQFKIEDLFFLRDLCNFYTSSQQMFIDMCENDTDEVDETEQVMVELRNKNISGFIEFAAITPPQYIIFLNFSLYQKQIFRTLYAEANIENFAFNPVYYHKKLEEIFAIASTFT